MSKCRIASIFALTAVASLAGAGFLIAQTSVSLETGWKFIKGDNPAYADPGFDDSGWSPILVDRIWEAQGNDPYDGYAWYRIRVVIPSTIRQESRLKEGLRIALGKINNFDLSFLNGRLFGRNGKVVPPGAAPDDDYIKEDKSLYDLLRTYILPFDDPRILWDKENVIAVRVFDEGGQGGMFDGEHGLRAVGFRDFITLDYKSSPFVFSRADAGKTLTLRNDSLNRTFRGTLTILAVAPLDGSQIRKKEHPVELVPGGKAQFDVRLPKLEETVVLTYTIDSPEDADRWEYRDGAPYILTPEPPAAPRLTGPKIVGARPGRPFLHALTATGQKPMTFAVNPLPRGLNLNPRTGIITGRPEKKGTHKVEVIATNPAGEDRRVLKIVIGPDIALTPQMGWNSWNVWGTAVDAEKVKDSARAFVDKGLLDHGWTYINIDDGWEIPKDDPRP
ncbi:MAG: putative Ig domain-containing protein, partial [Candidatus Aminicenantes bacterium]|nr:putative Ig domain-containing protein [Candidatus Aminicenantes bacterium]